MHILRKMFCSHNYVEKARGISEYCTDLIYFSDLGTYQNIFYSCSKCGKEKTKTLKMEYFNIICDDCEKEVADGGIIFGKKHTKTIRLCGHCALEVKELLSNIVKKEMDIVIEVKNIINSAIAMSPHNGELLGNEMAKNIVKLKCNKNIILDFKDIDCFSSLFFIRCIEVLAVFYDTNFIRNTIKLINIKEIGETTYNHCINSITEHRNMPYDSDEIGRIAKDNIDNM